MREAAAQLEAASVRAKRGIFDRHVVEAWPAIAQAPASELSQEQVVDMPR
ncbi:MAG: hypothetical protein IPH51_13890 [Rubrivivax sp.]|nr:hypothetical protein [Rubrivivax sp.]